MSFVTLTKKKKNSVGGTTGQTRNELKKVDGLTRSAKKDFDIFSKKLDQEMYKLVDAGLSDILFSKATSARAMSYWDDVLKFMRGDQISVDNNSFVSFDFKLSI